MTKKGYKKIINNRYQHVSFMDSIGIKVEASFRHSQVKLLLTKEIQQLAKTLTCKASFCGAICITSTGLNY